MDVAIDGGQTGLRLALAERGEVLEVREVAGLSYAEGSPVDAVLSRLETFGHRELDTVCLGLTTILDDPDKLAARLLEVARRVLITADVVTSHAGAFPDGTGVVLAAGTGAIALGITPGADPILVDGWGYLFGDAGSGYRIGQQGLDAAYRGFDGRGEPGALTARAREVFGDLAGLPARLYLAPDAVAQVARFAVHVFELASFDSTAGTIVDSAATELAGTVAAASRDFTGEVPVAWTGRLLRDDRLRAGFERELATRLPRARVRKAAGDSLAGAARLAATDDLAAYTPLIQVTGR